MTTLDATRRMAKARTQGSESGVANSSDVATQRPRLAPTPGSRFVSANGLRFHYRSLPVKDGAARGGGWDVEVAIHAATDAVSGPAIEPAVDAATDAVSGPAGGTAAEPTPTLVFLHGIMGHAFEWDAAFDVLRQRYRVIALDQRGHGRTEWARPYTVETLGDDVAAVVEALDLQCVTLVGHSMGGLAAIEAAWRHPGRFDRLVLVDIAPGTVSAERAAGLAAWLADMAEAAYEGLDEPMALWRASNPIAPEPLLRNYVGHALAPSDDARLRWAYDAAGLADAVSTWVNHERRWRALAEIAIPTLVVRGESSTFVSRDDAREMARTLPDGAWVEIAGAGHDMGVQRPEAVAAKILQFAGN